ncbi:hypothetical protein GXM_00899 [Nostoc sphaeroides CCNUC1]|uniref:Uncharacterized protein n=1 Tax=Nostoc sphaeroides CCNUC1 TaxID=2653204 RepID=A0A5P8VTB0_9NOSO|nr:hypothetical protein GXM_00899 [Nostoc sphaeroides CCNUC1]
MGDRSHCGKSVIDNPQLGLIVATSRICSLALLTISIALVVAVDSGSMMSLTSSVGLSPPVLKPASFVLGLNPHYKT